MDRMKTYKDTTELKPSQDQPGKFTFNDPVKALLGKWNLHYQEQVNVHRAIDIDSLAISDHIALYLFK